MSTDARSSGGHTLVLRVLHRTYRPLVVGLADRRADGCTDCGAPPWVSGGKTKEYKSGEEFWYSSVG